MKLIVKIVMFLLSVIGLLMASVISDPVITHVIAALCILIVVVVFGWD